MSIRSLEHYKKIAGYALIGLLGEQWARENASELCSCYGPDGEYVRVTFSLASYLPTEEEIIYAKDDSIKRGSISFLVDPRDESCKVDWNMLPKSNPAI